jgi:phenolic acid decarboxylase
LTSQVWITVGELEQAFERKSNILPPTSSLAGVELRLYFENGWVLDYRFVTAHTLHWRDVSGKRGRRWTRETYHANEVRDGIYFVDYLKHFERATTVSIALDLKAQIFTAVIGELPTQKETKQSLLDRVIARKELTCVKASFFGGSVDKPFDGRTTPRHTTTDELIGKRVEYTYSPTERYEHVYLNRGFYTWHCLAGVERTDGVGLADTDRCHHFKLGDKLYLLSWQEKIIPTHGVVIVDLDAMRSSGKIFGYQGNDFRKLSNFPVGAKARILSQVR